jgi:hypothetical protein
LGCADDVLAVRRWLVYRKSTDSELDGLRILDVDPLGLRTDSWLDSIRVLDSGANSLMLGIILIVLLVLLLLGALPQVGLHESGYGPGVGIGTILIIVLILYLLGVFR